MYVYLGGDLYIYWPLWQRSFFSDSSPIAWYSSAQLVAIAFIALRITIERSINFLFGAWLFISTFAMALDEQFQFHELWKYTCPNWFWLCKYRWVIELPILMVGFLGFATLVTLHKTFKLLLQRFLFWIAVVIGLIAIIIDQASYLGVLSDFEEGFEVLAEAFFLASLLAIKSDANIP